MLMILGGLVVQSERDRLLAEYRGASAELTSLRDQLFAEASAAKEADTSTKELHVRLAQLQRQLAIKVGMG